MPVPTKPTITSTGTSDHSPATPTLFRRITPHGMIRRESLIGWLFVIPALFMYAMFVLLPLLLSVQYSFFRWDGIVAMTWVGLQNYLTVLDDPDLLGTIVNAFRLVIFFSIIPVVLGLIVA